MDYHIVPLQIVRVQLDEFLRPTAPFPIDKFAQILSSYLVLVNWRFLHHHGVSRLLQYLGALGSLGMDQHVHVVTVFGVGVGYPLD